MRTIFKRAGRVIPPLVSVLVLTLAFVLSPGLRGAAQTWIGGFLRDSNKYLLVDCTNCGSASGVQSVTAGDASVTMGGTTQNPTVAVNQANPFNLSGLLTNTASIEAVGAGGANACAGSNYPANATEFCAGGNNPSSILGMVVGPSSTTFNCTASCTAGDSQRIAFYDSNASGVSGRECDLWKYQGYAMLETSCGIVAASTGVRASMVGVQNTNDWEGTCASVNSSFQCVTGTHAGITQSGVNCFAIDVSNHAIAVDTSATLTSGSAHTFTHAFGNGFVGSTSTAPTTADSAVWFCMRP